MPRFEFRLKSLLTIREAQRDLQRLQLAEARAMHDKLIEQRTALRQEMIDQMQFIRSGMAPGQTVDVQRLAWGHRYELVVREKLSALAEQEQAAEAEVARRRESLLAPTATCERSKSCRERQLEEFRKQQASAESRPSTKSRPARRVIATRPNRRPRGTEVRRARPVRASLAHIAAQSAAAAENSR